MFTLRGRTSTCLSLITSPIAINIEKIDKKLLGVMSFDVSLYGCHVLFTLFFTSTNILNRSST